MCGRAKGQESKIPIAYAFGIFGLPCIWIENSLMGSNCSPWVQIVARGFKIEFATHKSIKIYVEFLQLVSNFLIKLVVIICK